MKRKMIIAPPAFNYKAIGDVINYINYYKPLLDVYLLVKGFENIKKVDGYTIVNPNTSFGKYLKLTAEYIIDAGGIKSDYKASHSQFWISISYEDSNKKMFVDIEEDIFFSAIKYGNVYDCMISSSPYYTNTFLKSSMKYRKEIKELGSSRVDTLINFDENRITEIKNKCGIPLNKKIVLYMPIFRKKGQINISFSAKRLLEVLGDDYVVVTKFHYLNFAEKCDDFIDCTDYQEVFDLMHISEFLISDYSSYIIDYALLNKPIFLYQFDKKEYSSKNEIYFDFSDYLPNENIVESEDSLIDIINKNKNLKVDYSLMINKFYPYEDGKSTERIANSLNLNYNPRKSKDLIFLIKDLNEIGGVHTFIRNMAQYYKEKYDTKIFVIAINEFTNINSSSYIFDCEYVDYFLSSSLDESKCKLILENTSGNIISMQFSAHRYFQKYLNNKNVVLMYHGDSSELILKKRATKHLDNLNSKKIYNYKKLLLLSNSDKEKLSPYLNEEVRLRFSYMNNSIGLSYNKIESSNKNSWAFIGRIDDGKNPFALIEIGKIILKDNLKIKINVYGDGPLKDDLENIINEFNLNNIIIIHGFEKNKVKIFKENVGLIMTSKYEGYPYVILEAYAYGKPVVLFNTFTAAQELVDHNKTGFLIENENYQDMIEKMNIAMKLDDNDIKNKFLLFNNDVIFEKWDNIFNEIKTKSSITNNSVVKVSENRFKKIIKKVKKRINKKSIKRIIKKIQKKMKSKFPNMVNELTYYQLEKRNIKKIKKSKINNSVTIIIPYYNNYETIKAAIDSVLMQKYPYYEIIVVDDGSQNKCKDIVSSYNNSRIKYYYKENEGLGLTRNFGIKKATSEYVMFLDADDTLYRSSIMSLLTFAIENDLAVVSGITERKYVQTNFKEIFRAKLYKKNKIINLEKNLEIYLDILATNKLYKRKLLLNENILFKKGLYEDKMFTALLYSKINKIGIINEKVYVWNIYGKNTSISTSTSIDDYHARIKVIDEIWNDIPEKTRFMMISIFFSHDFIIYIREYLRFSKQERKDIFNKARYVYNKYKEYTYLKLIKNHLNKYMFNLVVENNYILFDEIALSISEKYIKEYEKKVGIR